MESSRKQISPQEPKGGEENLPPRKPSFGLKFVIEANDSNSTDLLDFIERLEATTGRRFETDLTISEPDISSTEALARNAMSYVEVRRRLYSKMPRHLREEVYLLMLIDLFVSESAQRPVATKNLGFFAGCSPTTSLRYIERLRQAGLIRRKRCISDKRLILIELTDAGRALALDVSAEIPCYPAAR